MFKFKSLILCLFVVILLSLPSFSAADVVFTDFNTPDIEVFPGGMSIDAIAGGSEMNDGAFLVRNVAEKIVNITRVGIAGSSSFSVTSDCGPLAPGTACNAVVSFSPDAFIFGYQHALLVIESSAGFSFAYIHGYSSGPAIKLSVKKIVFNEGVDTKKIVVSNNGYAALDILSIRLEGPSKAAYSYRTNCSMIDPGYSCTISVTLRHRSVQNLGLQQATIVIQSNDPREPLVRTTLLGK